VARAVMEIGRPEPDTAGPPEPSGERTDAETSMDAYAELLTLARTPLDLGEDDE
jgi:hypothetical protein